MTDVTNEEYAKLKEQFDNLTQRYNVLEEKSKAHDSEIAERDEKIKNLNDALYKAMFTTKPETEKSDDDEPKDFTTMYMETLKEMANKKV